jgi:glycosyltransferase involved in cell wall biosynthesis
VKTHVLTVCIITYNHAAYIRKALESVFSQQTSFPFNVVIADDFSTDETREILYEFQRMYPDRIELRLQPYNVGPAANFLNLLKNHAAEFIAYLEGDDFWTDSYKLQKQVDFLKLKPTVAGCFHDVVVVDEAGRVIRENYYIPPKDLFLQSDCLEYGGAYCTGSLVFRSYVLSTLPDWFIKSPTDYAIDFLLTEFGSIAHLRESMGAYRIHEKGIWQGNQQHLNLEKVIDRYKVYLSNNNFRMKYGGFFKKRISEVSNSLAIHYQTNHESRKKWKYIFSYVRYAQPKDLKMLRYLIGSLLFPSVYGKLKKQIRQN